MFKSLINSLLGRIKTVPPHHKQEFATLGDSEAVRTPVNTPPNPEGLPLGPTPSVESARRPHILSHYAQVNLADNPLAIREVRKTGPVTWMPGVQGWCISPSTSFPLTVVGGDEETAYRIREALDGLVDHYSEDVAEAVAGLAVERGARFHEFEDYIQKQRQTYRTALAAARGKESDRSGHPDADVEEEIEGEALDALDRCCQDFETLIEGNYPNDPGELAAIRSYGYGNLLRYLGTGPPSVKLVPPGTRRRIGFEALAQAGLAIGVDGLSDIPTASLLHAMTVKEIQSLSSQPIPSKSRKKNLAVEFVLGQDGIRERAIAATALDSVFYLVPPPSALSGLDLGGMHERMSFAWGATNLVVTTYITAALAATNREYEGKHLPAERFKVHNICDVLTCRSCRKAQGESRPLAQWDRFPFHFGCRCSLLIDC